MALGRNDAGRPSSGGPLYPLERDGNHFLDRRWRNSNNLEYGLLRSMIKGETLKAEPPTRR